MVSTFFQMIFGGLFGRGRNVVKETAEVFRENAEAGAVRAFDLQTAATAQFAAEFAHARKGWFDRFVDAMNRVPRPAMALGVIALMITAMVDPVLFAERMQGLAVVPEPVWWLMGIIVGFYFGARHQAKSQDFERSIAETMARVPVAVDNIEALRALDEPTDITPGVASAGRDASLDVELTGQPEPEAMPDNPALAEWREGAEADA